MTVTLRKPTLEEVQQVRVWRNDPAILPTLRTGYKTDEQQAAFYRDVVCAIISKHRYYAILADDQFIGLGGLTYLDRAPGEAEISLLLGPEFRGAGYGAAAVEALLETAMRFGLTAVVGECYAQNPAKAFWLKMVAKHGINAWYQGDSLAFRMRAA